MSKHICSIKGKKATLCPNPLQAWCKSTLFNILGNLRFGRLSIDNCGQLYEFGDLQGQDPIIATLSIHDPQI
ncbi:MAG: hypothetical protein C0612_10160, partial [Desulfobulbaceae bacterium]